MSTVTERTPPLQTKLPAVGTTIFTVMSALATEKGAVNLGQGFPDFDCDPRLVNAVTEAMTKGLNQYPPMTGIPALRAAVAAKIEAMYGHSYDPGSEITITAGATQAIITAILAIVRPGDEVIVLEPCYEWQHVLVLPLDHPLAKKDRITLEDLAPEPIITYHPSFTGRTRIDSAFAQRKLQPRIALEAIDSDVIKTYVRLGLGIGIVAEMAVRDDGSNADLAVRPLGGLFGQNVARVAFKRSAYLRNFVYKFAELLSDRLDRNLIAKAMSGHVNDYEL